MATDDNQPLQAWTCGKCGAALPAEAGTGELVTCGYCGTPFTLPTAKASSGGVTISGGSVTIDGDVIGGSKVATTSNVARPAKPFLDIPAMPMTKGVTINAEETRISGDVIAGSVVEVTPSVSHIAPKVAPAAKLGWWEKIRCMLGFGAGQ